MPVLTAILPDNVPWLRDTGDPDPWVLLTGDGCGDPHGEADNQGDPDISTAWIEWDGPGESPSDGHGPGYAGYSDYATGYGDGIVRPPVESVLCVI